MPSIYLSLSSLSNGLNFFSKEAFVNTITIVITSLTSTSGRFHNEKVEEYEVPQHCPMSTLSLISLVWNDEELSLTGLHPWHHIHVLSPGKNVWD